ncbi:MAG: flavin reductase [Tenuifilaceae bacterium]|nr:flavin reductase [Tenuifilaceae bacterium]
MEQLKHFELIDPFTLKGNVFEMLDKEWMLITAGSKEKFNTMTASWGSFGFLWRKPVSIIYVRPQRYTFEFTEANSTYTLSFFGEGNQRKALAFCGAKSGRDFDKPKEAGLTPVIMPNGGIAFAEARLIVECRKLYADDIKPEMFSDMGLDTEIYPTKDYHRFYIGAIESCYVKKG